MATNEIYFTPKKYDVMRQEKKGKTVKTDAFSSAVFVMSLTTNQV